MIACVKPQQQPSTSSPIHRSIPHAPQKRFKDHKEERWGNNWAIYYYLNFLFTILDALLFTPSSPRLCLDFVSQSVQRRSLDVLRAKASAYLSLAHERLAASGLTAGFTLTFPPLFLQVDFIIDVDFIRKSS